MIISHMFRSLQLTRSAHQNTVRERSRLSLNWEMVRSYCRKRPKL